MPPGGPPSPDTLTLEASLPAVLLTTSDERYRSNDCLEIPGHDELISDSMPPPNRDEQAWQRLAEREGDDSSDEES